MSLRGVSTWLIPLPMFARSSLLASVTLLVTFAVLSRVFSMSPCAFALFSWTIARVSWILANWRAEPVSLS